MRKKKAVLFSESKYNIDRVWSPESKNELETLFDLKTVYSKEDLLKLDGIDTVFILHDLYAMELKEAAKHKVENIIKSRGE